VQPLFSCSSNRRNRNCRRDRTTLGPRYGRDNYYGAGAVPPCSCCVPPWRGVVLEVVVRGHDLRWVRKAALCSWRGGGAPPILCMALGSAPGESDGHVRGLVRPVQQHYEVNIHVRSGVGEGGGGGDSQTITFAVFLKDQSKGDGV
jgi:hypothetical protein